MEFHGESLIFMGPGIDPVPLEQGRASMPSSCLKFRLHSTGFQLGKPSQLIKVTKLGCYPSIDTFYPYYTSGQARYSGPRGCSPIDKEGAEFEISMDHIVKPC